MLVLLIYVAITLLNVRGKIQTANAAYTALQTQVDAQTAENAALTEDIAASDDPEKKLEVAKEKLGLVESDEVIIYDTTN